MRLEETRSIPLPPAEFIDFIGGGDYAQFVEHGDELFALIQEQCDLTPSDSVLDIGSGCGRIARPLTTFLHDGHYDGIEVFWPMVDWCRREITQRFPHFRFHHADVSNTAYSPASGLDAAGYVFPFDDATFDAIFATSVFTHLVPQSAARYASEIARTLKPDGVAMLTFLLLNERSRAAKSAFDFRFHGDGYSYTEEGAPERVLGLDETTAMRLVREAGLDCRVASYGSWSGSPGLTYQDVVVARPAR